jgi:hypothetical protein
LALGVSLALGLGCGLGAQAALADVVVEGRLGDILVVGDARYSQCLDDDDSDSDVSITPTTVYRLLNEDTGEHAFTDSAAKRDRFVELGWIDEGGVWGAPESDGTPVYLLTRGTTYFYTADVDERDALIEDGYTDGGIAFRSYDNKTDTPVWRLCNDKGMHFFTVDVAERDALVEGGWVCEGTGFYAL